MPSLEEAGEEAGEDTSGLRGAGWSGARGSRLTARDGQDGGTAGGGVGDGASRETRGVGATREGRPRAGATEGRTGGRSVSHNGG